MSRKGWAFTAMAARRWAEEGIQEGTFYDAYGTYLGIEKKFSDRHTMTLNFIGSPYRRSTASPSTQEVYDYRGVHYNSYWGWQDGEKRSERVRRGFQPIFQLQDFWKINKNSSLWAAASYQFGKDKGSRLDWNGVTNPSPTYYRNLPSFSLNSIIYNSTNNPLIDPSEFNALIDDYHVKLNAWVNGDPNATQINWNRLYDNNRKFDINRRDETLRLYGLNGNRSLIYLADDVSDDKIFNAGTHYTYNFNDRTKFVLNLSYQNYRSELYREMKDLLGGDFAINIDPFKESARPGSNGYYNTLDSDVRVDVGDRMTYNYILRRQEARANPGLKFSTGNFDVFVSALAGYSSSNREGSFRHYLYENSYGKSKDFNFWNFGLKGQVVYRINGRNFFVYNGAMYNQAPFLEDLFINPRVNALVNPIIKSTVYTANDLSYVISTPFVKLRATGYLVDTQNETNVQRFFADGIHLNNTNPDGTVSQVQSAFVTQMMSNVEKRNMGAELGVDVKVLPTLSVQGLASYGQFVYRNNPDVYLVSDASGSSVASFGKAYIKNYKQGGTPQQAFSLGMRYNNPKYWWAGANWNYLDDNFLDPAPALRTQNFITNSNTNTPYAGLTEERVRDLLKPVKLPSAFFLNANAGKSFVFGKYYILITASVNNILNNRRYITGGFEQTRETKAVDFATDYYSPAPSFGPKYWYTQGRSYFVNMQFRF